MARVTDRGIQGPRDRILPVTLEIAEEWGRMNVPDKLPIVDGMLAATAKVHGMTLVTRDTGRLALHGVTLLNPFEPIR
jgi:toxin FitB